MTALQESFGALLQQISFMFRLECMVLEGGRALEPLVVPQDGENKKV